MTTETEQILEITGLTGLVLVVVLLFLRHIRDSSCSLQDHNFNVRIRWFENQFNPGPVTTTTFTQKEETPTTPDSGPAMDPTPHSTTSS